MEPCPGKADRRRGWNGLLKACEPFAALKFIRWIGGLALMLLILAVLLFSRSLHGL